MQYSGQEELLNVTIETPVVIRMKLTRVLPEGIYLKLTNRIISVKHSIFNVF